MKAHEVNESLYSINKICVGGTFMVEPSDQGNGKFGDTAREEEATNSLSSWSW